MCSLNQQLIFQGNTADEGVQGSLSSRFLQPGTHSNDDDDNVSPPDDDAFDSKTSDRVFEPGNRLEASGFNADDLPTFAVSKLVYMAKLFQCRSKKLLVFVVDILIYQKVYNPVFYVM